MAGAPSPTCILTSPTAILTADSESLTVEIIMGGWGSGALFEAPRPPKRAAEDGPFWAILTIPAFIQNLIYIESPWESFHEKKPHACWQSPCTCHYFYLESISKHQGAAVAQRRHKCAQIFFNLYTYKTFGLIYIYIYIQEYVPGTDQRSR